MGLVSKQLGDYLEENNNSYISSNLLFIMDTLTSDQLEDILGQLVFVEEGPVEGRISYNQEEEKYAFYSNNNWFICYLNPGDTIKFKESGREVIFPKI